MLCSFSQCLTNLTSDQACTENQNLTTLLLILVTLIKMAKELVTIAYNTCHNHCDKKKKKAVKEKRQ